MSEEFVRLNTIVAGGGICGLSSAIALRRAGHNVTIYERHGADSDAGAGIVLGANATRVLSQWGLDLASVGALRHSEGLVIDGKTLRVLAREPAPVGHANTTRHDLRLLLTREVERIPDLDRGEGTIKVVYEQRVTDYDATRPAVQLADGIWVEADLVVACDGIRSKAAKIILGKNIPAIATGYSAFRLVIDTEKFDAVREKFPDSKLVQTRLDNSVPEVPVWFAVENPGRIFVWWTCRFGQVSAMDIIMPDNDKYAGSEEWLARCDKQVLIDEYGHWHPVFTEIVKAAEDPLLYKICARDPVEILHKGSLCILGDALHPMAPYRGQGGSQSIEDAGALEMCLTGIYDRAEVPRRLELLQKLRVPRYATVQLASSVRQDEPNVEARFAEILKISQKWFEGSGISARMIHLLCLVIPWLIMFYSA